VATGKGKSENFFHQREKEEAKTLGGARHRVTVKVGMLPILRAQSLNNLWCITQEVSFLRG